MSLYRPIPQLQLAANVQQPLSPLSVRDYGKLLYWIFFFPQAVRDYLSAKSGTTAGGGRRHLTIGVMATLLLFMVVAGVALAIYDLSQRPWIGLDQGAARTSALGGALIGLFSALITYLLQRLKGQPAHAIVLGMAAGVTYTFIGCLFLGEGLDRGMFDMLTAFGYGIVGGNSIGVMQNLAFVLNDKAKRRTLWQTVAALLFGGGIFLINSLQPQPEYWTFALDLSEENGWATVLGALAFYGGAQVGFQRPLDWLIGKIYLNLQLFNQPSATQFRQFTKGTNSATLFAPPLEAIFAPTAPVPLDIQPYLPHVTLYPIQQLRFLMETWLYHDWERGVENAKQIWRYTRQRPVTTLSLQQILHEGKPDDQLNQVSKFVDKLDGDDWQMLFYAKQPDAKTIETIQKAQEAAIKDPVALATAQAQRARTGHQRRLLRQALKTTQRSEVLPLDTTAQRAVAGFWYLTHSFAEEGGVALQDLPNSDLVKELKGIATSFQKLLFAKDLLTGTPLELPERPKEPKRKATWDALDNFSAVVRFGRLYHQCRTPEKKAVAYETALLHLNKIEKEAAKVPGMERPTVSALALLWYQELSDWVRATRSWQKMKPDNPFIFLESLRGRKPFVGRDDLLTALKAAGTSGSLQPVLLHGLVHSGKSSLLQKATFDYYETACYTLFSIVETEKSGLSAKTVLWAMCQALNRRTGYDLPDERKFQSNPFAVTEEMIRDLCRKYHKFTQMIVVANVDLLYATTSGAVLQGLTITRRAAIADSLINFWWRLAETIGNLNFVFVSQTGELPVNPFTPALKKLHLKPLELKDTEKLLNAPTAEFTPLFSRRAAAQVYYLSGGQPYLAQLLAHCVISQFNSALENDPKPEPVFLPEDINAVLDTPSFRQFSQNYFQQLRGQLEALQPGSNGVLQTIAANPDGLTSAELENALNGRYIWAQIEKILMFLEAQQAIKHEGNQWKIIGELLRSDLE